MTSSVFLESVWGFTDRVCIDGDKSLIGSVTGLLWHNIHSYMVEVSWMHNGASYCAWVHSWRLSKPDA
jgi:hypothetical protein